MIVGVILRSLLYDNDFWSICGTRACGSWKRTVLLSSAVLSFSSRTGHCISHRPIFRKHGACAPARVHRRAPASGQLLVEYARVVQSKMELMSRDGAESGGEAVS